MEDTDNGALKRVSSCPTKTNRREKSNESSDQILIFQEKQDSGCSVMRSQPCVQPRAVSQFRGSSIERHDAIDLSDDDEFVTDDAPVKLSRDYGCS